MGSAGTSIAMQHICSQERPPPAAAVASASAPAPHFCGVAVPSGGAWVLGTAGPKTRLGQRCPSVLQSKSAIHSSLPSHRRLSRAPGRLCIPRLLLQGWGQWRLCHAGFKILLVGTMSLLSVGLLLNKGPSSPRGRHWSSDSLSPGGF